MSKKKIFSVGDEVNVSITGRQDDTFGVNGIVLGSCFIKPLWSDTKRTIYMVGIEKSLEYKEIPMTTSIITACAECMWLIKKATKNPNAVYRGE